MRLDFLMEEMFRILSKILADDALGDPKKFIKSSDFSGFGTIQDMVKALMETAIYLTGVVAVGYFIYGGYKYIMSGGNDSERKQAKDTILWGAIGVIIVLSVNIIYEFVVVDILGGKRFIG